MVVSRVGGGGLKGETETSSADLSVFSSSPFYYQPSSGLTSTCPH